jgi:hypothetical protein
MSNSSAREYYTVSLGETAERGKAIVKHVIKPGLDRPISIGMLEIAAALHISESVFRETHSVEEWECYLTNKRMLQHELDEHDAQQRQENAKLS